ncbi:MAG TPA: hypothetical protein QGF05_06090 [Dehalococcoidia bacterium]|nr:hypothetical protein [Dehalococcoidia bacterium]
MTLTSLLPVGAIIAALTLVACTNDAPAVDDAPPIVEPSQSDTDTSDTTPNSISAVDQDTAPAQPPTDSDNASTSPLDDTPDAEPSPPPEDDALSENDDLDDGGPFGGTTLIGDAPEDGTFAFLSSTATQDATVFAGPGVDWARRGTVEAGDPVKMLGALPIQPNGTGIPTDYWVRVESLAIEGWALASELPIDMDLARQLQPSIVDPIQAIAATDGIALFKTPGANEEPERILARADALHLAGRSPDANWIAGSVRVSGDCDTCYHGVFGWAPYDPDSFTTNAVITDLPVLATFRTKLFVDAATVVDGDIGPHVTTVNSIDDPFYSFELPNTFGF